MSSFKEQLQFTTRLGNMPITVRTPIESTMNECINTARTGSNGCNVKFKLTKYEADLTLGYLESLGLHVKLCSYPGVAEEIGEYTFMVTWGQI